MRPPDMTWCRARPVSWCRSTSPWRRSRLDARSPPLCQVSRMPRGSPVHRTSWRSHPGRVPGIPWSPNDRTALRFRSQRPGSASRPYGPPYGCGPCASLAERYRRHGVPVTTRPGHVHGRARSEPPRVCRRPISIADPTIPAVSRAAWKFASVSTGGTFPIGSGRRRLSGRSTHSQGAYSTASTLRHGPRRWIASAATRPLIVSARTLS